MKYELKSIGIWSFIKISFVVNLILGFIIGFMYAIFMGMIMQLSNAFQAYGMSDLDGEALSFGMLMLILPIFFSISSAIFNTIIGLILVFVYNFFTRFMGGLEFNLEQKDSISAQSQNSPPSPEQPKFETPPPPPPVESVPSPPYVETVTPPPPDIEPKTDNNDEPPTNVNNNDKRDDI